MANDRFVVHLLLMSGEKVILRPNGALSPLLFETYRTACKRAGAVYDGRNYVSTLSNIRRVSDELVNLGFRPNPSAQLTKAITGTRTQNEDHLKSVNLLLAKQGVTLRQYQEDAVRILNKRKSFLLCDKPGTGKQQPVDTLVITPSGWRRIGDLRIGDVVTSSTGQSCNVTAIYPQGIKPSYRITMDDGSFTEAGPDHLWLVEHNRGGKVRVGKKWNTMILTTDQLRLKPILIPGGGGRTGRKALLNLSTGYFRMPMLSGPVNFDQDNQPLPIAPYLLGALIANGSLAGGATILTINENDTTEVLLKLKSLGYVPSSQRKGSGCDALLLSGLKSKINTLGLSVLSPFKFIPQQYLSNSINARIELLHGLMDCDGSISCVRNRVAYFTSSLKLAMDVISLVEQLGGTGKLFTSDGRFENRGIGYRVIFKFPILLKPFSLTRKASRYRPQQWSMPTRRVESVQYVADKESVCITVDSPDNLYVTEHCIVTHNTKEAIAALPNDAAVVVVCPKVAKLSVWKPEFEQTRPGFKVSVLRGLHSFRWPKPGEVVITGYSTLPSRVHIPENKDWGIEKSRSHRSLKHECYDIATQQLVKVPLEAPCKDTYIIADECQYVFNPNAQRTKAFNGLLRNLRRANGTAWGLTGTPLDTNPMQLWHLLECFDLAQEAYVDFPNFLRIYGGRKSGFGSTVDKKTNTKKKGFNRSFEWNIPGPNSQPNKEAVDGLRRVSLMRKMEDVMSEVPPLTIIDVPVEIDELTIAQCNRAVEELDRIGVSLDDAINQCINNAGGNIPFQEMSTANKMLATAKVPFALDFIEPYESAKEPFLLFSMHVDPLKLFEKRDNWGVITGKVTDLRRTKIINSFKAGEINNLAISMKAAGVALSLERAAYSLFIDFAYAPAMNEQAAMRIRRMTQRRPQFVYRLIANHALDIRKIELLDERESIINATTDASRITGRPDSLLAESESGQKSFVL